MLPTGNKQVGDLGVERCAGAGRAAADACSSSKSPRRMRKQGKVASGAGASRAWPTAVWIQVTGAITARPIGRRARQRAAATGSGRDRSSAMIPPPPAPRRITASSDRKPRRPRLETSVSVGAAMHLDRNLRPQSGESLRRRVARRAVRLRRAASGCRCSSRPRCRCRRSRSNTRWPGASPQEVEQEIVIEQEEQLKSVEGITKLSSESMPTRWASITLEFGVGTDMEEALLEGQQPPAAGARVSGGRRRAGDQHGQLVGPADRLVHSQPAVRRRTKSSTPSPSEHPELADELEPVRKRAQHRRWRCCGCDSWPRNIPKFKELLPPDDLDVTKLRRFAEDEIEARFERVPGVSQSNVIRRVGRRIAGRRRSGEAGRPAAHA